MPQCIPIQHNNKGKVKIFKYVKKKREGLWGEGIRKSNSGYKHNQSAAYVCMEISQWNPLLCTINIH
jgi:hypothetical protein